MKAPYVLTPAAARDVEDIWEHVAQDSIPAAYRVATAIEAALARLAKRPGIGHLREDLATRDVRFLLVYSYLIVYRSETKPLQIIRVLHAARDLRTILGFEARPPQE